MNRLKVKAAAGLKFAVEGKWRIYVTDDQVMEVPDSPYYRRALQDGDLLDMGAETTHAATHAATSAATLAPTLAPDTTKKK